MSYVIRRYNCFRLLLATELHPRRGDRERGLLHRHDTERESSGARLRRTKNGADKSARGSRSNGRSGGKLSTEAISGLFTVAVSMVFFFLFKTAARKFKLPMTGFDLL